MPKTRVTSQDVKDAGISTADLADDCVTADKLGILTAKGQLIGHDGTGPVVVPADAAFDKVLVTDATASGLTWRYIYDFLNATNGVKITGTVGTRDLEVDFAAAGGLGLDATPQLMVQGVQQLAADLSVATTANDGKAYFHTGDQVNRWVQRQALTSAVGVLGRPSTSDSTTVSNTTTSTQLDNSTYRIQSNHAQPSRAYRVTAWGRYSTTGTPNLLFEMRIDAGGVLASTGNLTTISNASNRNWMVRGTVLISASGAGGATKSLIEGSVDNGITNVRKGTLSLGLNTGRTLAIYCSWGTASASNACTCDGAIWESLG